MEWDLSDPKQARSFLKNLLIGPDSHTAKRIEYLQDINGKRITIDQATDEQVLQVVNELAEAQAVGQKNLSGKKFPQ